MMEIKAINNARVGVKLTLSYLILMLLTAVTALIGFWGNSNIDNEMKHAEQLNEVVRYIKDIRGLENSYASNHDPSIIEEISRILNLTSSHIDELLISEDYDGYENSELSQISIDMSEYQIALDEYVIGVETLNKMLANMRVSGREVDVYLDKVRQDIKQDLYRKVSGDLPINGKTISSLLDTADDSNRLIKSMLEARKSEKNFIISSDKSYQDDVLNIVAKMKKLADDTFNSSNKIEILNLLDTYEQSFIKYFETKETLVITSLLLKENTEEIERLAEKARLVGNAKLDDSGDKMVVINVSIAIFALTFGGLLAFVMSRSIIGPLDYCVEGIKKVSNGDLNVDMTTNRKDELGQLISLTGDMAKRLRDMIGGIKDNISYIATSSEELSALTNETTKGVNAQQQDIEQVATAMTEMSASAHEVALKAENTLESANLAYDEAKKGNSLVVSTVNGMSELSETINASEQVIQSVRVDSENIVSILDVIKNISDQTNLLALNAAIEAARAGDHGRGFAVVADEVRSLAQKTQNSTVEIERMIDNLKTGAESAVDKMVESKAQVSAMVVQTEEVNCSLSSISKEIGQITEISAQAHQAVTEQGLVAEEVSTRMNTIQGVVEQTSLASQQTDEAGKELARIGEDLRHLSDMFVLKD